MKFSNETLKEMDTETIMKQYGLSGSYNCRCYSPDGKYFLSSKGYRGLTEFDAETSVSVRSFEYNSNYSDADCFAYRPDGRRIVSAYYSNIRLWDTETGDCLREFDGTIKKWDAGSKYCLVSERFRDDRTKKFSFISYCPNGNSIIIINDGTGVINEWDPETGKHIRTIPNIVGLLIQGVDMRNLHPDSVITDEEKEILRQYGAII